MKNEKFQQYIDNFIKVLSNEENVDLSIFNDNLQSLEIIIKDNDQNYFAGYDRHNNIIRIKNEESVSSIYHELLHAASTRIEDGFIYSGLSQEILETKLLLGLGLTEGITEFLNEQYFETANKKSYFLEKFYVKRLLELVSEEAIKNSYFKADNEALLDELIQYTTFDEIKLFLYNLDTYTISMQNPENANIEEIQDAITECTDFLINVYYNKLSILNIENIENMMKDYINEFNMYIIEPTLNNQQFTLLSSKKTIKFQINKKRIFIT